VFEFAITYLIYFLCLNYLYLYSILRLYLYRYLNYIRASFCPERAFKMLVRATRVSLRPFERIFLEEEVA